MGNNGSRQQHQQHQQGAQAQAQPHYASTILIPEVDLGPWLNSWFQGAPLPLKLPHPSSCSKLLQLQPEALLGGKVQPMVCLPRAQLHGT